MAQISGPVDFRSRLRELASTLTSAELRIADFIENQWDKVAYLRTRELAELLEVSHATVVRFAQKLGYKSYRDLQGECRGEIPHRVVSGNVNRLRQSAQRVTSPSMLSQIVKVEEKNLQHLLRSNPPEVFDRAVDLLVGARGIYTVGHRGLGPLAQFLGYGLNLLRPGVKSLVMGFGNLVDEMLDAGPQDCMLLMEFFQIDPYTQNMLNLAKHKGMSTIGVVGSAASPLASHCDLSLVVGTDSLFMFYSPTSALALCHALMSSVGLRIRDQAEERLAYFDEMALQANLFGKKQRSRRNMGEPEA